MPFRWLRNRRRRALLGAPFPPELVEVLRTNVRHYQHLPTQQRERVHQIVPVLMAEKEWAPAAGFTVERDMRATIAGVAATMVSGLPEAYYFDRLHTFVLHPGSMRFSPEQSAANPLLPESNLLEGVAWYRGPVLLAWKTALREAQGRNPGGNVTIHELAHHLDSLDGHMSGTPPMKHAAAIEWEHLARAEMSDSIRAVRRDEETLFEDGLDSPAEFFAVASERFFEVPHLLKSWRPELFAALASFYCQDPTSYLPKRSRWEDFAPQ